MTVAPGAEGGGITGGLGIVGGGIEAEGGCGGVAGLGITGAGAGGFADMVG